MSTPEVTADLLRRVEAAWEGDSASDAYARNELHQWAKNLEREQRPLPTVPGWYPNVVVERGGESCTGALLRDDETWLTAVQVDGWYSHDVGYSEGVTIRWAEQPTKTPGQTAMEAFTGEGTAPWEARSPGSRDFWERLANAVLAAHGTSTLTPVGEHPEPGTRGLLPVVQGPAGWYCHATAVPFRVGDTGSVVSHTVLADPRPDGAHA